MEIQYTEEEKEIGWQDGEGFEDAGLRDWSDAAINQGMQAAFLEEARTDPALES